MTLAAASARQPVPADRVRYQPAGFFVLRSPLLPYDDLAAWSAGLRAPAALAATVFATVMNVSGAILASWWRGRPAQDVAASRQLAPLPEEMP